MSDRENDISRDDGEGEYGDESEQESVESQVIIEGADSDGEEPGGGFKNARGKFKPYKKNEERITSSFLTKYERARVLGTRAL